MTTLTMPQKTVPPVGMKKAVYFCLLALFAVGSDGIEEPLIREWASKDGTRCVEGKFLKFAKDGAVIETESGRKGKVRFDSIRDEDWLYLQRVADLRSGLVLGYAEDSPVVSNRLQRLGSIIDAQLNAIIAELDPKKQEEVSAHEMSEPLTVTHEPPSNALTENESITEPPIQPVPNPWIPIGSITITFLLAISALSLRRKSRTGSRSASVLQERVVADGSSMVSNRQGMTTKKGISASVQNELCFLDIETTGLNTTTCDIIEICLLDNLGFFSTLIDPGRPIPASSVEINGIDSSMVIGKPMFKDIACQIWQRVMGKIVVGHNVSFDLKFLYKELRECGIENVSFRYVCTCDTEREYRGSGGNKLFQCLGRRGLNISQTHRAEDDVRLLRTLYVLQCKEKKVHRIQSFASREFTMERERERIPSRPLPERRRTSFSLKTFSGWGEKCDLRTQTKFAECLKEALRDRIFDEEEMASFMKIGISQKCGEQILRNSFCDMVEEKCQGGVVSWESFDDIRNNANLLGIPQKVLFDVLKKYLPTYHTVCYTGDVERNGEPIDRYGVIYPWSVENGYLPMNSITKQTDLVVYCRPRDKYSTKADKAIDYKIRLLSFDEFSEGKSSLWQ